MLRHRRSVTQHREEPSYERAHQDDPPENHTLQRTDEVRLRDQSAPDDPLPHGEGIHRHPNTAPQQERTEDKEKLVGLVLR
jgi:hypothetical protein